ncbi:replication protein [Clostridioides difficile]|uniref:DnaD domain-containing protein n=2 Tax=Clostridioides TaxID=1870884 RepID=UPI000BB18AC9|nr:DnaD domain protein [Clostridioides difficile]MCE4815785.1 DnaD domain protein [Clostridioides difficile]PBF40706.1 replication protein [Clostridioides difficile]HAU4925756.1 DnaD domain protein [Clostridioides difficile]HBF5673118.1 DnaD domain protein [Clostridioides difficile]
MGIIRVSKDKDNPYVILNKTCLEDEKLSWQAKGLHTYLISKPDDWKIYIADLKNRSKNGRDSTANILRELIKAGYITRTACRNNETNEMLGGYDYEVYEIPLEHPQELKSRKTDSPENGKPDIREIRYTENPSLLNNELKLSNEFKLSNITTTIDKLPNSQQDTYIKIKKYYETYIGLITPNNFIELTSYLDDGMEADVIIRAIDEAIANGVKNYKYIKTILNNWIEAGVKTSLELTEYQNEFERKKKSKQEKKQSSNKVVNAPSKIKKTNFHNFDETFTKYTSDELDDIIKKSQKEKFK